MGTKFEMWEGWGFIPSYEMVISFNPINVDKCSIDVRLNVSANEITINSIDDCEGDHKDVDIETVREMVQKMIDEDKFQLPDGININPLTGKVEK